MSQIYVVTDEKESCALTDWQPSSADEGSDGGMPLDVVGASICSTLNGIDVVPATDWKVAIYVGHGVAESGFSSCSHNVVFFVGTEPPMPGSPVHLGQWHASDDAYVVDTMRGVIQCGHHGKRQSRSAGNVLLAAGVEAGSQVVARTMARRLCQVMATRLQTELVGSGATFTEIVDVPLLTFEHYPLIANAKHSHLWDLLKTADFPGLSGTAAIGELAEVEASDLSSTKIADLMVGHSLPCSKGADEDLVLFGWDMDGSEDDEVADLSSIKLAELWFGKRR